MHLDPVSGTVPADAASNAPRTPRSGTRTQRTPGSATRTYLSPPGSAPRTHRSSPGSALRSLRSSPGSGVRRSPRLRPYSSPTRQPLQSPTVLRQMDFASPQSSASTRPPRSPAPPSQLRQSPMKTGRPRNDIWQHYVIERENGKKHGRCRYCGTLKKNGKPSGNLLKHLINPEQCPGVPRQVQVSLRPADIPDPNPAPSMAVPPPAAELSQDAFEMALARVFFVCALPFMLIETQIFRDFIGMVAPTMKVPSRHKLSGVLLKRVRDEMRAKVIKLINKQVYVSLVTDGWSDTNGSSIINFMVVAPGMPSLFWSSWSTRSEQHTAAYLAGEIDKVISDIESATTAHVVAVVTDNARNMSSARSHIQAQRPNVVSGGCSAHVLNLLMQDVCRFPVIQAVRSRAVAVTRFVRDHLALLDEFKTLQQGLRDTGLSARNLVLPVPTRWYSVFACLRSVLNSREVLEKIFLSSEYDEFRDRYRATAPNRKKLRYMMELVRDNGFWDSLRTIVRLLDPIIAALRQLEGDNVFVSGVYKWFRWLRYHTAYGVTSPEQEVEEAVEVPEPSEQAGVPVPSEQEAVDQARNGIELLSNSVDRLAPTDPTGSPPTAPAEPQSVPASETSPESTSPDDERFLAGSDYRRIDVPQLEELQHLFRDKIRNRWSYVHTNTMSIAFLLDPSTDIDDFVSADDENVDDHVCEMARRCGLLTPTVGAPAFTAEVLAFKSKKRRGGKAMREKYSMSSPRDYWEGKKSERYPLLQKIAQIVFATPTSSAASERAWSIFDHIHSKRRNRLSVAKVEMLAYVYINYGTIRTDSKDLARHQSRPESVDAGS